MLGGRSLRRVGGDRPRVFLHFCWSEKSPAVAEGERGRAADVERRAH